MGPPRGGVPEPCSLELQAAERLNRVPASRACFLCLVDTQGTLESSLRGWGTGRELACLHTVECCVQGKLEGSLREVGGQGRLARLHPECVRHPGNSWGVERTGEAGPSHTVECCAGHPGELLRGGGTGEAGPSAHYGVLCRTRWRAPEGRENTGLARLHCRAWGRSGHMQPAGLSWEWEAASPLVAGGSVVGRLPSRPRTPRGGPGAGALLLSIWCGVSLCRCPRLLGFLPTPPRAACVSARAPAGPSLGVGPQPASTLGAALPTMGPGPAGGGCAHSTLTQWAASPECPGWVRLREV